MNSRTIYRRELSPQNHTYYSRASTNQNRSTFKSTNRDSFSSQPLAKTKKKGAAKSTGNPSKGLSKKKFQESLQRTYERYVGHTPTNVSNAKISKTRTYDSQKPKTKKKDSTKPKRAQSANENLHSRVADLQKNIDSQEKMLYDLKNKLITEKSELSQISQHISGKKPLDTLEDTTELNQTNKSTPMHSKYQTIDDRFGLDKDKENKSKPLLGTRGDNYDKTPTKILSNERIIQAYSSEESYKHKWLYLKEHVSAIENHYELKIKQLTQEVARLTEENYKLKYRQGGAASAGKDEMLERLETIYQGRIAKAEEKCEQKEKELIDREKSFKLELEDVYRKLEKLQAESKHNQDTDEKIAELKRQLAFRENENSLLKKYFAEKLQMKAEELTKHKEEWSKMHKELLEEIRELKRNVDQLSYENKKLSLSSSNQNATRLGTALRA